MEIFNSKEQNQAYIELLKEISSTFSGLTISIFIDHGLKRDYVDFFDLKRELLNISQSEIDSYSEQARGFVARLSAIENGLEDSELE